MPKILIVVVLLVLTSGKSSAGGPHLSFFEFTTTEGAPSLRSLQGWEPRSCIGLGFVRNWVRTAHPFARTKGAKGWGTHNRDRVRKTNATGGAPGTH